MMTLKSIPSLNTGTIEGAMKHFPQLLILDLSVEDVDVTHFITDALEKKPEMIIAVNDKAYVHSSLKAVCWAKLKAKFDLQWFQKTLVSVSFHSSGVPMLRTMRRL